jgi:branched-subunit amino acid ABC-type transport system permease component
VLDFVNFYLLPGLVLGCIYALGAVGVSLLYGILRFAHFAHGDLMTFGGYVALALVAGFGFSAYGALPVAIAATVLLGVAIDRCFYRPLRNQSPAVLLISGFGIALMVRAVVLFIWGPGTAVYQTGIQTPIVWEGFRIQVRHVWILLITLSVAVVLHLFLSRTRTGKAMRAMSDNADLARVSGIPADRVILWTWVIGAGLAAVAGVLLAIDTQLSPQMGWNVLLAVFAAAILGGIGKPYGAFAGGLILGLAEELASAPLFGGQPLVTPDYKIGVAFVVMVVMLVFRPTGLFRGQVL